ncbi:MAG: hypothetical protein KBS68_02780 [Clostridiales bacterium]|nr:hypothetical protein [Candidatus Crickella merdequi]
MANKNKAAQRQKRNKRMQITARIMAIIMIIVMVLFTVVIGIAGLM